MNQQYGSKVRSVYHRTVLEGRGEECGMSIAEAAAAGINCVRAGEGNALWMVGDTYTIKASAKSTGGAYGLVEASIPPGGGPPPHSHSREDEAFYLLDGQLEFSVGKQTVLARTGDYVFLPRGNVHCFTNPGLTPTRTLILVSPGGFEQMFQEAGTPAQAGRPAPPFDPADAPRLAAITAGYGSEIIAPPTQ
jgi:quercetin dioxygenase-like cupin family protein